MKKLRDFLCTDCGAEFESLVKDGVTPSCPDCDSTKTVSRISAPKGLSFKGVQATSSMRIDR